MTNVEKKLQKLKRNYMMYGRYDNYEFDCSPFHKHNFWYDDILYIIVGHADKTDELHYYIDMDSEDVIGVYRYDNKTYDCTKVSDITAKQVISSLNKYLAEWDYKMDNKI